LKPSKKFVFSRREPEIPFDLSPAGTIIDGAIFERQLNSVDARGMNARELRIEASSLERVNLADSSFNTITIKDARLTNCDIANLSTRGLTLLRVELIDCRMTGLSGGDVDAQDVLIRDGDQRYSQMRSSRFRNTEFDNCNFEEGDFQGTDFTGAIFRRCNLRNVEMGKARLPDADLRGSIVEGMHIAVEGLRGAVVDPAQAMTFALLLGIRIE
jgi:uncharacterized protein YjbI with pentapeptide repeats